MKTGLLVVSFGTTHLDTLEKTIAAAERVVARHQQQGRQMDPPPLLRQECVDGILKRRRALHRAERQTSAPLRHAPGQTVVDAVGSRLCRRSRRAL